MALYKTHLHFNLFIAMPVFLFFLYSTFHLAKPYLLTFATVFIYASYFLTPDADLSYKNHFWSLKGILTFPFFLYSLIFRHRGISHMPIVGTLTRLLYLTALIALSIWLLDLKNSDYMYTFKTYKNYFSISFLAFILSDLCHLLLDWRFKI